MGVGEKIAFPYRRIPTSVSVEGKKGRNPRVTMTTAKVPYGCKNQ